MDLITADSWLINPVTSLHTLTENWEAVPLIGAVPSDKLQDGQLVRFRGMVQDMLNPVCYLEKYEIDNKVTGQKEIRSGKYRDCMPCGPLQSCDSTSGRPSLTACGHKRSNSDEEMDITVATLETHPEETSAVPKRICVNQLPASSTSQTQVTAELIPSFPIPDERNQACLVNLYDEKENSIKLNEMIEVAGFLSRDPMLAWLPLVECTDMAPPPSLVPRIHAVSLRKLNHSNPLITPSLDSENVLSSAPLVKRELHLLLSQLLFGDALAANYLICHLISSIFQRFDTFVLGKFSLNICNIPPSNTTYAQQLYEILSLLVTKSHYLPMTLANMNSITMLPKKDYESNRLSSGRLQLSSNTHLVLDETKLEAGQLDDKGVRNVRAISDLLTNQKLDYDFKFYTMEFETNIPVLILSEGKSMLPTEIHIPLVVDSSCQSNIKETFIAAKHFLKEPLLSQLRSYITIASAAQYELTDEAQEIVQQDFVTMRQDSNQTISPEDLHSLLVLARLLSLGEGKKTLTKACWETACEMERQRKARQNKRRVEV